MKALGYREKSERVLYQEISTPKASTLEVVVRVLACGVNSVDLQYQTWKYYAHIQEGFVLGTDVVGEIVEVGHGVPRWKKGDYVIYHGDRNCPHGGFAEFAKVSYLLLLPLPDVEPSKIAVTPYYAWNAYRALVWKMDIASKDAVFITQGASGLGLFALQFARYFGVPYIITTCFDVEEELVYTLGATDHIYPVDTFYPEKVTETIERMHDNMMLPEGIGVNGILDTVGEKYQLFYDALLSFNGVLVNTNYQQKAKQYSTSFYKENSISYLNMMTYCYSEIDALMIDLLEAGRMCNRYFENDLITIPRVKEMTLSELNDYFSDENRKNTMDMVVMVNK